MPLTYVVIVVIVVIVGPRAGWHAAPTRGARRDRAGFRFSWK
jgi:hypothetical protein